MAYEPTEWKSGDVITSAKLNKLENGVAGAVSGGAYIVNKIYNEPDDNYMLDKTAAEVLAAAQTSCVISKQVYDESIYLYPMTKATLYDNGEYEFNFGAEKYTAYAADEYPATSGGK